MSIFRARFLGKDNDLKRGKNKLKKKDNIPILYR